MYTMRMNMYIYLMRFQELILILIWYWDKITSIYIGCLGPHGQRRIIAVGAYRRLKDRR